MPDEGLKGTGATKESTDPGLVEGRTPAEGRSPKKSRARSAAPRRDAKTATWYFVVDAGVKADGKRRQVWRGGFSTKRAAQEELDKVRGQARTATYVAPTKLTVAQFLTDEWLPAVRRELADSTWESYQRNIRLHVLPRIGGTPLVKVDGGLLNRLYADLLEGGRKLGQQSPGLKPRTTSTSTRSSLGR